MRHTVEATWVSEVPGGVGAPEGTVSTGEDRSQRLELHTVEQVVTVVSE